MAEPVSKFAGKTVEPSMLVNVPRLVSAYFNRRPDPAVPAQRVAFGTSGHRGSAFDNAFNEWHILAISQAICRHRSGAGITGPLYIGIDTHALSEPALASALEVFAANGVDVMIDEHDGYTPTPVISHAILSYNKVVKAVLPTVSSLRLRIIRPRMAATNTTRQMGDRPIPTSRPRSSARRTGCWKAISLVCGEFPTSAR